MPSASTVVPSASASPTSRAAARPTRRAGDAAVELEHGDRVALQVGHRGVAGAEVVQGQAHAVGGQLAQRQDAGVGGELVVLGDLQVQPVGGQARWRRVRGARCRPGRGRPWTAAEVDAHRPGGVGPGLRRPQASCSTQASMAAPRPWSRRRAGRCRGTAARVRGAASGPALAAAHRAGGQGDQRLVVQDQLPGPGVTGDEAAEVGGEGEGCPAPARAARGRSGWRGRGRRPCWRRGRRRRRPGPAAARWRR